MKAEIYKISRMNESALYHLQKAVGLYKEVEKHVAVLKQMGIELLSVDSSKEVYIKSGIEKFGLPISETKNLKQFEHCGIEVIQ